jgi:hypothetical protein
MTRSLVAASAVLLLAGCSAPAPAPSSGPIEPTNAVWTLSSDPTAQSMSLDIAVSRLECSGGVTGDVLPPVVSYEADRIVIRSKVAPLPEGAYDCQSNDTVPVYLLLDEPVGERAIFDEACFSEPAKSTSFCADEGIRWASDTK